jgi:hypothetical protein
MNQQIATREPSGKSACIQCIYLAIFILMLSMKPYIK